MSGHASHKSTSIKPNPNAVSGQNDADLDDILVDEGYPFDADAETETSPSATQRPGEPIAVDEPDPE